MLFATRCLSRHFLALIGIAACLTWSPATSADGWQPVLLPPPSESYWLPTDRLEIRLPSDTTGEQTRRMALELNNFDVSDLVILEGYVVVLEPQQPFATGNNLLRLLEYQNDGTFVVHGEWTIVVRETEAFQDVAARMDISAESSYRLADSNLTAAPDHLTARGGANVAGLIGEQAWRSSLAANFLYTDQKDRAVDGRPFDIGEFLLSGEVGGTTFELGAGLGHQDVGADNLLLSGFYRRGGTVRVATTDDLISVTGFALQSEPTVGFTRMSGLGDADNRADGVHAVIRPPVPMADSFELSATYYSGVDTDPGTGILGETSNSSGSGWSVGFDSLWLDNRLLLHGEFALTSFDFDGDGTGFASESDNAHYLVASYAPIQSLLAGDNYMDLTLGVEYKRVGSFYRTITNPSIVEDRDRVALFGDFNWGTLAVNGVVARETNNVDDNDLVPTDRAYDLRLAANYSPTIDFDAEGNRPRYGQPNIGIALSHYDLKQTETPTNFRGFKLNNYTSSATVSGGLDHDAWYLSLAHSVATFQDQTNIASNTISHFTDLSGLVQINDRLSLTPSFQWGLFRDQALDNRTHTINFGIGAKIKWISDVLDSRLNYTMNLQTGSNDTPDRHTILGDLVWVMLPAQEYRPGLEFSLNGQFDKQHDDVDDSLPNTVYQIYATLRMTFAYGY